MKDIEQVWAELRFVLRLLSPLERGLLRLRYGADRGFVPRTIDEAAEILALPRSVAVQIERDALLCVRSQ